MKPFTVTVQKLEKAYDLPGSWHDDDYRALLQLLEIDEVDDLSSADLEEVLLMALQDLGAEEAADAVLAYRLKNRITPGSRRNVIEDLQDGQRPWEEFADISLHAPLFSASHLLYRAFPKVYSRPDLMKLTLQIQARTAESKALLQAPLEAAFVTRLLADAMDEHSILERLFDEQLRAHSFPESQGIIWLARYQDQADGSPGLLTVYSSQHWLEDMESIDEFESAAYNDREPDNEED